MSSLDPSHQPYHFALLAYPRQYRYEHGAELVDAAQDLSGKPWSIRESASFLVGGLRIRGLIASQQGPRSVWAAGMRVALLLWFLQALSTRVAFSLGATGDMTLMDPPNPWLSIISLGAICVVLTITTRWPTALLISAVWLWIASTSPPGLTGWGLVITTIGLSWWLTFRTDGRRAMSPFAAGSILATALSSAVVLGHPFSPMVATALFLGPALAGIVLVTIDPRPLIVAATMWFFNASMSFSIILQSRDPDDWKFLAVPTALTIVGIGLSQFSVRRVAGSGG